MCAGALTAVTSVAGSIAFGAYDAVIAGGVEHMGRHPMGEGVDPTRASSARSWSTSRRCSWA
ncbi:beta-ketoacyl synthase N-terminal-like domain-containing protein [Streptomyces sp. MS1.AVA.1]|uniref:Beta-ketoacyl synthase N-terminal-like domain-containing protein n=1 Tax=Streptomyces machairae TaxID=3134109 RepID=A0ABU8URK3_9ACTN